MCWAKRKRKHFHGEGFGPAGIFGVCHTSLLFSPWGTHTRRNNQLAVFRVLMIQMTHRPHGQNLFVKTQVYEVPRV